MTWNTKGNANTNPTTDFVGTTDLQPLVIRTNSKETLRIDPEGKVGIGTANPTSKLEIAAQDGLAVTGFQPFITLKDSNAANARTAIQGVGGDLVVIPNSFIGKGAALVVKTQSGNVGIGTADPRSKLEIVGQDGMKIVGFQPFLTLADSNSGFSRSVIQGANGDIIFYPESFIAGQVAPVVISNGSGDVTMNGSLKVAKDVVLTGGDCAEHFDVSADADCEPGTVMAIGNDGALDASAEAYDKKVAGVVSGAGSLRPAIVLDKQSSNEGRPLVALFGKVYCKADAQYAPIEVGDLLTTSDTLGHAMKACDPVRAFGAVVGKALGRLTDGCGLIPILVTLQ